MLLSPSENPAKTSGSSSEENRPSTELTRGSSFAGEIRARRLLAGTGIEINGSRPWDLQVLDRRFYPRVFGRHSLGLGESYMEGWWEAARLDEFFYRLFRSDFAQKVKKPWMWFWKRLQASVLNLQGISRAFQVGEKHYDLGNDLFEAMLGPSMAYSCGYWKAAASLQKAQEDKWDLVCRKMGIKEGHEVLDVGGGWGGFARFAAARYGARVTTITVSREQADWARHFCEGLPVKVLLEDYRSLQGTFDRIVSMGMFEHVGSKNHRRYMEVIGRILKGDGLFLLHTIANNRASDMPEPWIHKYIFPNAHIPSLGQAASATEGLFVIEDCHNIGVDYDRTLLAWFRNFDAQWPSLKHRYGTRFYRMWKYYLMQSAAQFRARKKQVWQIVLSKEGIPSGYVPVR